MIKFACPVCHNELDRDLECANCSFSGEFKDGFYHLHRNDETWEKCIGQVEASERAAKKSREETPELLVKTGIESKNINALMFDKIMEIMGDVNGKSFLEIGGLSGWATKKFIEKGADLGINLDIHSATASPTDGKYIAVLGDGYYLPFADKQFDFVYDCAALHHFEDKLAMLKEAHRVTKNDGFYVSQGNPPRDHEIDVTRKKYMDDFGLIETMPMQKEYQSYFMEVYSNFNFLPVGINIIWWAKKQEIPRI